MPAKLLYENGPNWRYATGTAISDPAMFYESPTGKTHIVVSELEIELMRAKAKVDAVHSFGEVRKALNLTSLKLETILGYLISLDGKSAAAIQVPQDFPASLFVQLKNAGFPLEFPAGPLLFPKRAIKTAEEIKHLQVAQKANDAAFAHAVKILKAAKIQKNNTLKWQNTTLTAEVLRAEMNSLLIHQACEEFSDGPIVACGPQGAMPHERGHGPIRANQLIIIDCFPRHKSGYWADCTRTYLKGKASEEQQNIYNAVLVAQEMALKLVKPGANGQRIHEAVEDFFHKAGYKTGTDSKGNPHGFFHGLGHGVGLELHDPGPRTLSKSDFLLETGIVTSVEPGLYYSNIGGVRIEDTVVVTDTGHKNFAKADKKSWIIK